MTDELPPCGLYRTTVAYPERAENLPKGRLVYFHNHSDQGDPLVLLPKSNAHNVWTFHDRGYLIKQAAWVRSLSPLKREGFYTLGEHFHTPDDRLVPKGQIAQLGYNADAEPILFFPTFEAETNSLVFPVKGMKIAAHIFAALQPVELRGPHRPTVN